jgi:hypothetical protein
MRHFAPALLLVTPFAAHAGLMEINNEEPPVELEIQVWGTVDASCSCDGRHPFAQTFSVISLYAPPDSDASTARGDYTWDPAHNGTKARDFVTRALNVGLSGDYVRIVDGVPGSEWDVFTAVDVDYRPQYGHTTFDGLTVSAPFDFIHGDGLTQSFDFSPQEVGGTAHLISDVVYHGASKVRDGLRTVSSRVIDRIRVVPRVCRI